MVSYIVPRQRTTPPAGALAVVAQAHGVSVQQAALAWLLAHSDIMVAIPGTSSIDHIDDNVDAG